MKKNYLAELATSIGLNKRIDSIGEEEAVEYSPDGLGDVDAIYEELKRGVKKPLSDFRLRSVAKNMPPARSARKIKAQRPAETTRFELEAEEMTPEDTQRVQKAYQNFTSILTLSEDEQDW